MGKANIGGMNVLELYVKLTVTIKVAMEHFFYSLGSKLFRYPFRFILGVGIFVLLAAPGFMLTKFESEADKLWIPQDSRSKHEIEYFEDQFGLPANGFRIIFEAREDSDILRSETLLEALSVVEMVKAVTAVDPDDASRQITQDIVCERPYKASPTCSETSGLDYWKYNGTIIQSMSQTQLHATLDQPAFFPWGQPITRSLMFGGIVLSETGTVQLARAMIYSTSLKGFVETEPQVYAWQDAVEELLLSLEPTHLKIEFIHSRSVDKELAKSVGADFLLMGTAYTLIIIYTAIMLGKFDWIESKVYVSFAGVFAVVMAVIASFGIMGYLQVLFTPITGVLPLILLGIGVDDMFVIVDSLQMVKSSYEPEIRLAKGLEAAGLSISITSITTFMAFLLGSVTSIPAVQAFCWYAATAVLLTYLFQILWFTSWLGLDLRRVVSRRYEVVPCVQKEKPKEVQAPTEPPAQESNRLRRFVERVYAPTLMKTPVRIGVLVLWAGFTAASIYGVMNLEQGLDLRTLAPDGSYVISYFDTNDIYWKNLGQEMYITSKQIAYWEPALQDKLVQLRDDVLATEWATPPTSFWLTFYLEWMQTYHNSTLNAQGRPINQQVFITYLKQFLNSTAGERFEDDVVFDETRTYIVASRQEVQGVFPQPEERASLLTELRDLTDEDKYKDIDSFCFQNNFVFYESDLVLLQETVLNLAMAGLAVFLVTAFLLVHPWAAIVVCGVIFLSDLFIMGSLRMYDIPLNNVSVVNLVMAIGLVFDYVAHIAHGFMDSMGTKIARSQKSLSVFGVPVINGGCSTFLGILALAFSNSSIFRVFFWMLFSVVVYGVLNAVVFLPVLLSFIGPGVIDHHTSYLFKTEKNIIDPEGPEVQQLEELKVSTGQFSQLHMAGTPTSTVGALEEVHDGQEMAQKGDDTNA
jgi:predicted RND superfamily exporter protein